MKTLITNIAKTECLLRELLIGLLFEIGFDDSIEFDGEVITKVEIEEWLKTLKEIDKKVMFV